jgi:hypothetical protein
MRRTCSFSLLAGAAVSLSGAAAIADSGAWSSGNADEVRALVSQMLADTESRSSLLQGGGAGGHDGKFFLASSNNNFRLNVSGMVQFRWVLSFRDDGLRPDLVTLTEDPDFEGSFPGQDDFDHGFENRRTRLVFDGHVYDPSITYKVQGDFGRSGGTSRLLDAYIGFTMDNGGKLTFGQFKAPFNRERLVSSSMQLAADRSLTNEVLNVDRTQGIMYSQSMDNFRFWASFNDGADARNTGWADDASDFGITARGEFLFAGDWSQFRDFTSEPGAGYAGMVGAAVHFQEGKEVGDVTANDILAWTLDVSFEGNGWGAFGAFTAFNIDPNVPGGTDTDTYGMVLQGSLYFSDNTEGFLRYDHLMLDEDLWGPGDFGASRDIKTVTLGVNHYMHGHGLKLTADLNWVLDPTTGLFIAGGGGLFGDGFDSIGLGGDDDEDEIYIRAQLQLLF